MSKLNYLELQRAKKKISIALDLNFLDDERWRAYTLEAIAILNGRMLSHDGPELAAVPESEGDDDAV